MLFHKSTLPLTFCLVFSAIQLGKSDGGLNPAPGVTIPTDDMGGANFLEGSSGRRPPPRAHEPGRYRSPAQKRGIDESREGVFSKRYQSALVDQLAAVDASVTGKDLCDKSQKLGDGNGGDNDVLYAILDFMYHPEDKETSAKVGQAVANLARVVIARDGKSLFDGCPFVKILLRRR